MQQVLPPIKDDEKLFLKFKSNTTLSGKKKRNLPSGTLILAPDDEPLKIGKSFTAKSLPKCKT